MSNFSRSALVATLLVFGLIGAGQLLKPQLAASRQGTLVAGIIGSFVFLFTLTASSNFKMSNAGVNAKSGLGEVIFALFIGVLSAGMIHRIAITICVIFSGVLLYLVNIVSQQHYNIAAKQDYVANVYEDAYVSSGVFDLCNIFPIGDNGFKSVNRCFYDTIDKETSNKYIESAIDNSDNK
ncbi:hypothetical protein FO519_003711 [Halicephalobus sp. NKZ332]|nr:hypothetical protein FO519_003711 [Halicephalobus sp. NKZ332]